LKQKQIRILVTTVFIIVGGLFLFWVKGIIAPFLVGIALAYLLSPIVDWLEKKGLKRGLATGGVFLFITVVIGVVLFLLMPKLYNEIAKLIEVFPGKIEVIENYIVNLKNVFSNAGLPAEVNKMLEEQMANGQNYVLEWLKNTVKNLPGALTSLGLLIISPILAIYFIMDWKKIEEGVVKIVPQKHRGDWHRFLQEVDLVVQRYIQGNIIVALIVAVLVGGSVKILGMEYAIVIGVISGVTNLIPYFGPFLGGIPSVLLALSKSPGMGIKVAIVILVVQQLESNVISPRLMSDKVGLHPLWIVFALLAGGEIAGIMGMVVAIPVAAVIKIILVNLYLLLVSSTDLKSRYP